MQRSFFIVVFTSGLCWSDDAALSRSAETRLVGELLMKRRTKNDGPWRLFLKSR